MKAAAPGRHVAASAAPIAHFVATIPRAGRLGPAKDEQKPVAGDDQLPASLMDPAQDLKSAKTVKQNRRGGAEVRFGAAVACGKGRGWRGMSPADGLGAGGALGGAVGHGRWVPGGTTFSTNASAGPAQAGFGHSMSLSPGEHPSDTRKSRQEAERVERADRAFMWREMSGSVGKRLQSPHTYDALVLLAATSEDPELLHHLAQIDKDLLRTFPDNPMFRETGEAALGAYGLFEGERSEGLLLEPLRRVLSAYCMRNPGVGYCQATNFVAGTLLQVLPEDDAFWVLCCVIEDIVAGYYSKDMLVLRTDLRTLEQVTAAMHPQICNHLQKLGLPLEMAAMRWLLSLFTCVFHHSMVVEILDELLTSGRKVLFQVAVGFMNHVQPLLLQSTEAEEAMNILNATPMTSTGFLSRFQFTHLRLAGLDEIRSSVADQLKIEEHSHSDTTLDIPRSPRAAREQSVLSDNMQAQQESAPSPQAQSEQSSSLPILAAASDFRSSLSDRATDRNMIGVRVLRGANMPHVSNSKPNCFVCASLTALGQFISLDEHHFTAATTLTQTHVQDGSTNPIWNDDLQFCANGEARNLVLTVYHRESTHSRGKSKALGQVNIGLREGTWLKDQWYHLQDKEDQQVVGEDGRSSMIQVDLLYSHATSQSKSNQQGNSQRMGSPMAQVRALPDARSSIGSPLIQRASFPNHTQVQTSPKPLAPVSSPSTQPQDAVDPLHLDYTDIDFSITDIPLQVNSPNSSKSIQTSPQPPRPREDDEPLLSLSQDEVNIFVHKQQGVTASRAAPAVRPHEMLACQQHAQEMNYNEPRRFWKQPTSGNVHSGTAPMSPPLLVDSARQQGNAFATPFMYPINRGAVMSPTSSPPQPRRQPSFMGPNVSNSFPAQVQASAISNNAARGAEKQGSFPWPNTWYGRYKQRRNENKRAKQMQRERAMEMLRQQDRSRDNPARSVQPYDVPHRQAPVVQSPMTCLPSHTGLQSVNTTSQHLKPSPSESTQAAQPGARVQIPGTTMQSTPKYGWRSFIPQVFQQTPANKIREQAHSPPHRQIAPPAPSQHRQQFPENSLMSQVETKQRIANWLGDARMSTVWSDYTDKIRMQSVMPRPMEPSILDVYAGTGVVRFAPGATMGHTGGKRFESFSGHTTPMANHTFSPVALSAVTAPTPNVNTSLWSSWEGRGFGEIPLQRSAYPPGYDPTKPYSNASPPPGAFSLRPQEVVGDSVAAPHMYMTPPPHERGGDVVIQPSFRPTPVRMPEIHPNGTVAGSPEKPIYFPHLPGKDQFNVAVESLNVDSDLTRLLAAQDKFMREQMQEEQFGVLPLASPGGALPPDPSRRNGPTPIRRDDNVELM